MLLDFAAEIMLFRYEEGLVYASLPLGQNSLQSTPVQHCLSRDWIIPNFHGRYEIPPDDRPLSKIFRTLTARALVAAKRRRCPDRLRQNEGKAHADGDK